MTAKNDKQNYWNLPNALTVLRLCLVPVYIALFILGNKNAALVVFLSACLTDLLDGKIARHYNLITDFGKLMDPLADKVMVVSAMLSMGIGNPPHIMPVIPLAAIAVVLLKEAFMVWGGLALYKHGIVTHSSLIGKVAHALFTIGLIATFFHQEQLDALPHWPMMPDLILIWAAVALTLCAMVFYVSRSLRKAREMGIIGKNKSSGANRSR